MDSTANTNGNFFTHPWWAMGQPVEGQCGLCINETATRARAGLLNVLSGTTIFILLAAPELDPIRYVAPFVIFDMVAGATFGLTPFSPAGILGTMITRKIKPVWKRMDAGGNIRGLLPHVLDARMANMDHRRTRRLFPPDLARSGARILRRLLDVFSTGQV